MSQATRCPSCGTVFRVVDDQLKVREGWVRCGRCGARFDARGTLFALDQPTADAMRRAAGREPPAATAPPEPPASALASAPTALGEPRPAPEPGDVLPAAGAGADAAGTAPVIEPAIEPPVATMPGAASPVPEASTANPTSDRPAGAPDVGANAPARDDPMTVDVTAAGEPVPTPGFVLRAERAERWRGRRMQALLVPAALALALALAAQMAVHYRDRVAAHWPQAQPGLEAACAVLGCTVEAPRRIDSLNIESSTLARTDVGGLYRLQLVLRNRAPTAARMPAIELALTDSSGQTLVRRVLDAAELGSAADRIPAGGEVLLQAALDLGTRAVSGYSVEPFYP